ncbi:MAG: universal stress protein [Dehalococcoidia bacterium]|nr:universal stress protein [Dehalococcoidia bacterium]
MYERMLVPLDGSELAEVVIDYAREVASRLDMEAIVLHVYRSGEAESISMRRAYVDHVSEMLQCRAVDSSMSHRRRAECRPVRSRSEIREGLPADEILRYADEAGVHLILMATHGYSGIRRWALGSTADKVVRASRVPVWLVRAGMTEERLRESVTGRTIVVPLDGSDLSESVLPHIRELAGKGAGMEIVLIRVCEPPTVRADYPAASMPRAWEEHYKEELDRHRRVCRDYLDKVRGRFSGEDIAVRAEVLFGLPEDKILDYENDTRPALVAMATHGRSGISRWAFGSVAERVLMGGSGPLLLVRPQ